MMKCYEEKFFHFIDTYQYGVVSVGQQGNLGIHFVPRYILIK